MKKYFLGFLTCLVLCFSFGVGAIVLFHANEVEYTPKDTSWDVSDVESALNDLYKGNAIDQLASLKDALKYSDIDTEDKTFDEIIAALKEKFPENVTIGTGANGNLLSYVDVTSGNDYTFDSKGYAYADITYYVKDAYYNASQCVLLKNGSTYKSLYSNTTRSSYTTTVTVSLDITVTTYTVRVISNINDGGILLNKIVLHN